MSRPSTFGPLVRWELVRLARRGYVTRVRVLFLYTLFLGVIGFALATSFLDAHRNPFELLIGAADPLATATPPRFGSRLAFTLLELQLLFVAAITPAYAAAAVSEEKDRRTFSMLLATQLTDREIVWGKAAGRALFVILTIAAGIPIL
ncbi:MAG TPA: hypothetical protein VLM40_18190, partial [Gemmata sp.]|nr:hypothetical protein [Gemmata sp.]